MCVNFTFWWNFILTFCHCKHRGIAQPSPVNLRWIRSFLPQKAGHLQEVERENKDLLHCVTSHIFSSARRQNTSLSGPSGWACMRRQQQCVPVCVYVCVCVCMALVGETVPAITGQTESTSTVHCNHKHSYASRLLQTPLWMVLANPRCTFALDHI